MTPDFRKSDGIMTLTEPSLDLHLLEKLRQHAGGKVIARCPACAEQGHDRTGNHLAVFPDGRFACAAHPGDSAHRKRIFALVGIRPESPPKPDQRRQWTARRNREHQERRQRESLAATARANRRALIERHAWPPPDVVDDSPQRVDQPLVERDGGHFLTSLFPDDALTWTGDVHESGKPRHAHRWKPCAEWRTTSAPIGPMASPATWKPGTISRSAAHVLETPYTVLDFDGLDGIKPTNRRELRRHVHDSLGIIRWLREDLDWRLAAIVWTGGKSLHAWFHTPPPEALQSLRNVADPLGLDAGLIGRPEHPCRLPGQRHAGTGGLSRVLWLRTPPS